MSRCDLLSGFRYGALLLLVMAGASHADIGPSGLDARPSNPLCVAPARPTGGAGVSTIDAFPTTPAFTGPVKILQAPGDGSRWFVVEQSGRVKVFSVANPASASTYIDFSAKINSDCASSPGNCGESGLLGMAFHPNFPATPEVFLAYTAGPSGSVPCWFPKSRTGDHLSNTTAPAASPSRC